MPVTAGFCGVALSGVPESRPGSNPGHCAMNDKEICEYVAAALNERLAYWIGAEPGEFLGAVPGIIEEVVQEIKQLGASDELVTHVRKTFYSTLKINGEPYAADRV